MNDFRFCILDAKIRKAQKAVKKAEDFYQFAANHGSPEERDAALAACLKHREQLEKLKQKRTQMIGEKNHAKATIKELLEVKQ